MLMCAVTGFFFFIPDFFLNTDSLENVYLIFFFFSILSFLKRKYDLQLSPSGSMVTNFF